MLKNIPIFGAAFLLLTIPSFVYAGRMELTTYYPAPYGEYSELKATGKTTSNDQATFTASGNTGTGLVVTDANQVGIGTTDPQGVLDVASTTSAFFPPRVTTAERNAIATARGAVVYNKTTNVLEFYNGSAWVSSSASAAGLSSYRGYDTKPTRCPDNTGSFTGSQVCTSVGKTCVATQRDTDHSCTFSWDCNAHGGPANSGNAAIVWCK